MSYQALYRTYRPGSFEDFAGQKHIVQTIKNSIKNNKTGHAYLFAGPRGTGKTSMAKLFAKAINCKDEDNKPCNNCSSCNLMNNSIHPDIVEMDAASNNGVEEVRNLIDKVKYAPIEGRYKIYIIDEVHMMSTGAFNALLKTLEEPPAHVIFILATTEPHKIIPTILSRCQRFDFNKLSNLDISNKLQDISTMEDIQLGEGVIELISELADGGMRDALSILEQAIAYAGKNVKEEHVREIYGLVPNSEKFQLLKMIVQNDKDVFEIIDNYDIKSVNLNRLVINLIDLLKETLIYDSGKNATVLKNISEPHAKELLKLMSTSKILETIDILLDTLNNFKNTNSPRSFFELACLKMFAINAKKETKEPINVYETIESVEEKVAQTQTSPMPIEQKQIKEEIIEKKLLRETTKVPKQAVKEPEKQVYCSDDDLLNVMVQANREDLSVARSKWKELPKLMSFPESAPVASMLMEGKPVVAASNALILAYDEEIFLASVTTTRNAKMINSFLKAMYEKDIVCYCTTIENFDRLKEGFKELKTKKKLPKPRPFVFEQAVKKEDAGLEYGKNLFGDTLQIEEE